MWGVGWDRDRPLAKLTRNRPKARSVESDAPEKEPSPKPDARTVMAEALSLSHIPTFRKHCVLRRQKVSRDRGEQTWSTAVGLAWVRGNKGVA
jgi:hypothetical protein